MTQLSGQLKVLLCTVAEQFIISLAAIELVMPQL